MRIIERPMYFNRLLEAIGTPDIKVITGIRRCGKSTLLSQLIDHIRTVSPETNVIAIDYNLLEAEPLAEYHALHAFVKEHRREGVPNLVAIDEVQMCKGFEKAINSLHATGKYDIFLTGSNAFLLSSDLATLFTGRTFEIQTFPFSFSEFLSYHDDGNLTLDEAFDLYARQGGMPGSYAYTSQESRDSYVAGIYQTLILRDIVKRHRLRDETALRRVGDFLMDNISNVTSGSKVASTLQTSGSKITNKTVDRYLDYLCEAFAFYKVRRYDLRGRGYLSYGDKYYLCDQAFRWALLGTRNIDYGRVYENLVALELMRRGWDIYAGMLYRKEIDFVAMHGSEKVYIQVSDDIGRESTLERECAPLLQIKDAYPKVIIARTRHDVYTHRGVAVHDIARWLEGDASR